MNGCQCRTDAGALSIGFLGGRRRLMALGGLPSILGQQAETAVNDRNSSFFLPLPAQPLVSDLQAFAGLNDLG